MNSKSLIFIALLLSLTLCSFYASATFVPHQRDYFIYYEVQNVGSGTGEYSGYTDQTTISGIEDVNRVAANGTVSAYYSSSWNFSSNTGSRNSGNSSGNFTFSSINFLYINGTDDQTGYVNPTVWFCMDNSTPEGDTFYLLNTLMTVKNKNYSYYLPSQSRNVYAIFAQGKSNYQRNDAYGQFTATYTWDTFFDPSSGYIIGYDYTEQDTNPSAGFTYTEKLYITSASYSLTTAPATNPDWISDFVKNVILILAILVVIAIILIIIYAASRRRRRLPKHPSQQPVYTPPSETPPSPPPQDINLTPKQPPVQQIVIKEVVKVKCRYCGALIDSTAETCPFCGAPRT